MEISSLEIGLLCRKVNSSIEGYSVSAIYQIELGILLRLHHATKQELLIAISSFAAWLTTKNLSLPKVDPFVSKVRDMLERAKLTSVAQEGNERIAKFVFTDRKERVFDLNAEFFGGGNLVLSDSQGIILDVEFPRTFRHRSLLPARPYVLPPSRGKSLLEIDETWLSEALKGNKERIPAINWFGRNIAAPRKFVEEIFARSKIKPDGPALDIADSQIKSLAKSSKDLAKEVESSASGYILLPKDSAKDLEMDVCSIVPRSWKELASKNLAEIREFPTLSEALDEAQVHSLVLEKRSEASKEIRSKAGELESAIEKQSALLQKNREKSSELRSLALELMNGRVDPKSQGVAPLLEALELIKKDGATNHPRFISDPRDYLDSFKTSGSLASRLFDEAKTLEKSNRNILSIKSELEKKLNELLKQTQVSEERAEKRAVLERRARQWFERFRWFLASDLRLAIGGRDSTSNSVIINKYMEEKDLVFHADLHGSPFFVLKNSSKFSGTLESNIELELAQATVSFSRAWKDELGSADAFWVTPEQVKKSAPSGEYLPRGSFFIEGKKTFVRHLKVELSVGVMRATDLPNLEQDSLKTDSAIVVCGPEKSLSRYCVAQVKIAPGKEKPTVAARRIKQLLVAKTKQDATIFSESMKKISIDEIIRVMPSGSYKIHSEIKG